MVILQEIFPVHQKLLSELRDVMWSHILSVVLTWGMIFHHHIHFCKSEIVENLYFCLLTMTKL